MSTHCSETAAKPRQGHSKGNIQWFDPQELLEREKRAAPLITLLVDTVLAVPCLDGFAQLFKDWQQQHHLIPADHQRQRPGKLSLYKDFKHFCRYGLKQEFRHPFAELPSTGAGLWP